MEFRADDYKGWKRDSRAETELANKLREVPEQERFEFIWQFLTVNVDAALALANRCLREKAHFEALLRQGVLTADISSVGGWIEAVAPRLGCVRVVGVLEGLVEAHPKEVKRALFGLTRILKTADANCHERVGMLAKRVG